MNVKIIIEGKVRDKTVELFVQEYIKRLSPYFNAEVAEVGDGGKYFEKYIKNMPLGEVFIGMDRCGKKFDSHSFANWFDTKRVTIKNLNFVIGEAEGLSEKAMSVVSENISLSDMVFSYRVSLMVLAEQIYRAVTIINGHPYHK